MGKSRKRARGTSSGKQRIKLELSGLELAAGHDGFLRGKPEPVILLAALWATDHARTIGRACAHFAPVTRYPCTVAPSKPAEISGRVSAHGRLIVLAFALEEDEATDVSRVFGLLENVAPLRFWVSGAEVPAPVAIEGLPLASGPREVVSLPVNVLDGARDLGDRCAGDEYLGAWAAGVPADGQPHELRFHFVSPDRRNDWTALVTVGGHAQPTA